MNDLLHEIYATRTVRDGSGNGIDPFPVATPRETGQLLHDLIVGEGLSRTLEVGMAYGLSTLFICQAHRDAGGGQHVAIDPGQRTQWRSIGVLNLERAGLAAFCRLIEAPSHEALPGLAAEGRRLDLAYIDGMHLFDYALVDFFYVDRLLRPGGYVVFDDVWMPAIRRVVNFVLNNRAYERAPVRVKLSAATHARTVAGRWLRAPLERDPNRIRFVRGNVVVLRKLAEDARRWDAHRAF